MSAIIPDDYRHLLDEAVFVTCVTLMPDGQPQASVVWCSYDGTHIWVNSADGRQKNRNMARDPRVSIVALDPADPYRYLEVRGVVEEITAEGAIDHIHSLSLAYQDEPDYYKGSPEKRGVETRTIFKIKPVHTTGHD